MFQSVFWFVCFCLILWGHKISWVAIAHERQPLRQHVCEVCDPVCVCAGVTLVWSVGKATFLNPSVGRPCVSSPPHG